MDLFETAAQLKSDRPLAERLRPRCLSEVVGQRHVLKSLAPFLNTGVHPPNMILWGPPGCGKTTLARLIAEESKARFINLNAVETGAKEIRKLGEEAHERRLHGEATILFIDEIHRLNRSQQDVLLPFMEVGDFILIGATTENPSYELNSALLSRSRVFVLQRLSEEDLQGLLVRGCAELKIAAEDLLTEEARETLIAMSDGDGRKLLVSLETLYPHHSGKPITAEELRDILGRGQVRYDKKNEEHYDTISAFIKSVRGSDSNAALYYLARMLKGGEDPVFIARRLVILASEDIGNADPRALPLAVAGLQAVELVGMPEARINLAQVTTYLSSAPKSNASYVGINKAELLVEKTGTLPIPLALRSARTRLSKELGYGEGYQYAHEGPTGWKPMDFLPEQIKDEVLYEPVDRGFEKTIRQYLDWMKGKA